MQIAVAYRREAGAPGSRLRGDLERRLPRDDIGLAWDGGAFTMLVAIVDPQSLAARAQEDRLQRALAHAVREHAPIVLVAVDGASIPAHEGLPPHLAPIADLDPIAASDDYWDATVERVVKRVEELRPRRRNWVARLLRTQRRVNIVGGVGVVGTIVGILAAFGIIPPDGDRQQSGKVTVVGRAEGVTYEDFLEGLPGPVRSQAGPPPAEADTEGYDYAIEVALTDPEHDRYSLRWTWRDHEDHSQRGKPRVGVGFDAKDATGVHAVWVPCPPVSGEVSFDVEFRLVDDARPDRQLTQATDTKGSDCVTVEG